VIAPSAPSAASLVAIAEALFREAVERYGQSYNSPFPEGLSTREAVAAWLRERAKTFTGRAHPPGCMVVLSGINCTEAKPPGT